MENEEKDTIVFAELPRLKFTKKEVENMFAPPVEKEPEPELPPLTLEQQKELSKLFRVD